MLSMLRIVLAGALRGGRSALMTGIVAAGEVKDLVGKIYMAYGWPNAGTDMFFTPMPVARIIAARLLNAPDVTEQVKAHVLAAAEKTPFGQAMMLAGLACQQEEASEYFPRVVMPELMPHIEPVTVSNPCCGSGVMFLGAAQSLPR